ncbi:hypothetical protein [Thalassolituus sp. UBA3500]|uniref:hypothetical protein n=1 Tax=Thalassolituus sp. UBA3500 TaxID=1947664 RepID=UPI000C121F70|nr:hypothetical protein [Thalassolituus sp. UBA3500]MBN57800.1 hypothetical protein [Oceanospirillaceae bacterium]
MASHTTDNPIVRVDMILDGEAYKDHEIQIFTFARALRDLGDLLYDSSEELNGDRDAISVKVNSEFIEGSFGFEVLVELLPHATNVVEYLGLAGAAGSSAGGLFGVLKWLKGEKIQSISELTDEKSEKRQSVITDKKGRTLKVPEQVARLAGSRTVRRKTDDLIRGALLTEGTSILKFKAKKSGDEIEGENNLPPDLVLDHEDTVSFAALRQKELLDESYSSEETTVKFISATIKGRSGWKVERLGKEYPVKMEDELFIERLKYSDDAQVFGRSFHVRFGTRKRISGGKESVTYEIEKVFYEKK